VRRWLFAVLVLAVGCQPAPIPVEPGARDAALTFFRAVIGGDRDRAYDTLDADSRGVVTKDRFGQLATAYRSGLRFEPAGVAVTACDVQGDLAIAHVVLTGRAAAHQRFKDAVGVRRSPAGWRVVLPANFGRPR
jgi:hypothetical protein